MAFDNSFLFNMPNDCPYQDLLFHMISLTLTLFSRSQHYLELKFYATKQSTLLLDLLHTYTVIASQILLWNLLENHTFMYKSKLSVLAFWPSVIIVRNHNNILRIYNSCIYLWIYECIKNGIYMASVLWGSLFEWLYSYICTFLT